MNELNELNGLNERYLMFIHVTYYHLYTCGPPLGAEEGVKAFKIDLSCQFAIYTCITLSMANNERPITNDFED